MNIEPGNSGGPAGDESGEAWRQNLLAVWFVVFISISGANLVFPFMPLYLEEDLGIESDSAIALWAGLLGAATGAMMFVFSPIWGSLADRYGRKAMLLRAVLGAMTVMFLQGLAQEPWQLLVLRGLQGMFAGTTGAAIALVAAGTPRRHLGYAMGLVQTGQFTAQMFGPLTGGLLAAAIGFRLTFVATASLYAIGAMLVLLLVKESPASRAPPTADVRGPLSTIGANLSEVARQRSLLLVIGLLSLIFLSTTLVRPILSIVVDQATDERVAFSAGVVFAAFAFTSAIASFGVGRATAAVGYRRWLILMMLGAASFYLPVALVSSVALLAVLMGVVGLFSGAMLPTTNALIGALSPEGKQGSAFGLATSAQALT
ncbi:MAG TPA: MFS transporter, partial [Dehalococcoidia bacterium]|nr:MFS transporter [Dehalococcoidia bacterium]